jgi:hypothetical protein
MLDINCCFSLLKNILAIPDVDENIESPRKNKVDALSIVASTSQIITINKVTPTLTITSGNAVSGTLSATVTTTATGGRGGAITFAIVTVIATKVEPPLMFV